MQKSLIGTESGQFYYTAMGGLCSAIIARFQMLMSAILIDMVNDDVVVYLHGLLNFSNADEDHSLKAKIAFRGFPEESISVLSKKLLTFSE